MWPYWLMFLLPAVFALNERFPVPPARRRGLTPVWLLAGATFTLLIGYRYQVGGDWGNYLRILSSFAHLSLDQVWLRSDPGYGLLNWLAMQTGYGIYLVNLLCGLIFMIGLVVFCRSLPRPWLALAVAIPYLVIVVGMGYSRQGVALGLAMIGLAALGRDRIFWFVFWVLLGALFHKTAVILLPIAAFAASQNRLLRLALVGVVSVIAYEALLDDSVDALITNYIEAEYHSQGALVRGLMNVVPAAILLLWRRRFEVPAGEYKLWFWMAMTAVALFMVVVLTPWTTAADRVGLYMLPLQLWVFSHLPEVLGRRRGNNGNWVFAVLAYYALVQFVWLNFAVHARAWVPYRFYPAVDFSLGVGVF